MPASSACCTMARAASWFSAEPRWKPPTPRIETCNPLFPSGLFGTVPAPFAIAEATPNNAASWMKFRRVLDMLLRRRKRLAGIFGGPHHLLDLFLLHIEREIVGQARLRIVVFQRDLV